MDKINNTIFQSITCNFMYIHTPETIIRRRWRLMIVIPTELNNNKTNQSPSYDCYSYRTKQ